MEAALVPGFAGVRDTKNPDGGTLVFGIGQWASFLGAIKRENNGLT